MSAIDPGIEDGIKGNADEVDPNENERNLEEEEREDFEVPNRWWFASTASPLLAGTFGPMASGFNVLALAYYWRELLPPHGLESEGFVIKDPGWVIGINAASLFCALVGNASLLLNMAKRVKFAVAQPLTICGFFLAGILLIADLCALGGAPHYDIHIPEYRPDSRHALTQAFYYAIWAAIIYTTVAILMCFTVYGALRGHYDKQFHLTLSQRSLMLQTMSFVFYLLLGATVFCHVEAWDFVTALYWADVTVLTVGLGDFSPSTNLGRGLLFPFAIGGVLILGLVIGSIRSLVLERGREKMSARMLEKRRSKAVHNVDEQHQTIKISMFVKAKFRVDPEMSLAQKREQEFDIMRKVQKAADSERRYTALFNSIMFAAILWIVGAAIFMQTEYVQGWSYFDALYFSYTSLMTIGYGDLTPKSNSGKAFFVFWSLLAVPSLTILISNMGDTIVRMVSLVTDWLGQLTILPGEGGFRASVSRGVTEMGQAIRNFFSSFSGPGVFGISNAEHEKHEGNTENENKMLDRLAERLDHHVDDDERGPNLGADDDDTQREKDTQFYHYVLARECRSLQKDKSNDPSKQFSWADWEYYLKLIGDQGDPWDYPGQKHPDITVPDALRAPDGLRSNSPSRNNKGSGGPDTDGAHEKESQGSSSGDANALASNDGNVSRQQSVKQHLQAKRKGYGNRRPKDPNKLPAFLRDWSWLSNESPLLSNKSEADWILERMSAALERELNRQRKGYRTKPPIGLKDARRSKPKNVHQSTDSGAAKADHQG